MKLKENFLYLVIICLGYLLIEKLIKLSNEKFKINQRLITQDELKEKDYNDTNEDKQNNEDKLKKLKYSIDDTQFTLYDHIDDSYSEDAENTEDIFDFKEDEKIKMSKTFFEISIGGEYKGRVIMILFDDIVPKTTQNFKELCKNKFQKNIFHRVIKGFMIQGGDFTNLDGTGGYSIYGNKFDDENFNINHDDKGVLSMANSGPNTNGSQFFITTTATPHLNGKHVVFGKVIEGYNIIEEIENLKTDYNDKPIKDVVIEDSGVLD